MYVSIKEIFELTKALYSNDNNKKNILDLSDRFDQL